MAFIKIQNFVINTNYVAAIRLDGQTSSGEKRIYVLIATPKSIKVPWEFTSEHVNNSEWIEFTGQAANVLRDYFSSYNNVIDLMPQYQESSIS
ncbi:hypothetical protein RINTHH_5510 [Richelia intracellularis HH01]|jgi:hypothetical protein|uniref:Uncharacterized protein n=1 Tax=Richelia intracellularis HH01 TaxID=1165094 RepID=M1X4U6_9NOST|nr:hypothetical protein [Richelia intracellularis]CCH66706.1 hypothetical protein RINTHH_5510 [Richelia intracellularis HH01]HAE06404.1 hypothetical protein [Richelia sp.]